jgi:hypothetical protein
MAGTNQQGTADSWQSSTGAYGTQATGATSVVGTTELTYLHHRRTTRSWIISH